MPPYSSPAETLKEAGVGLKAKAGSLCYNCHADEEKSGKCVSHARRMHAFL